MRGLRKEALRVACVTGALAFGALARADSSNVRLHGAPGMAVQQAAEGALLRLESRACQQVLSDFGEAPGRKLQSALDELGETPASYLRHLVFFYDGASQRRCASGEILGGTQPGSRVVYVCPRQFFEAYRRDTLLAETFVIHETLHSLGLGENPPASLEITQRVRERCSERAALR